MKYKSMENTLDGKGLAVQKPKKSSDPLLGTGEKHSVFKCLGNLIHGYIDNPLLILNKKFKIR